MNAFWEYTGNTAQELPNYLVELSLRTKVGSQFRGKFFIKRNDYNPSGVTERASDEVFYQFDGVITSCAVQFTPDNTVQITADFVTTGAIQLRMSLITPDTILQEGGDDILLDQGTNAKLLLETDQ